MASLILPEKIEVAGTLLQLEKDRCERDLSYFIRKAWPYVEPANEYVEGWHVKLVCAHLEAITNEEIIDGALYNRLLINIPPRTMKTLLTEVFWPAWEWGPRRQRGLRYLLISHKVDLPIQWAGKLRRLLNSDWYQKRWPVEFQGDQNAKTKFENTKGGFVSAVASGAVTGLGGDRVILDDAMSWEDAQSDQIRATTIEWFLGALPTRLNNPDNSAIVVIEQRLHEGDVSGTILDQQLGYDHIRLPMRYDETFPMPPTKLGIVEIKIIRKDVNKVNISKAISTIANTTLSIRLLIKKSLPFKNMILLPVILISYCSSFGNQAFASSSKLKIESMRGFNSLVNSFTRTEPTSFICTLIRVKRFVLSTNGRICVCFSFSSLMYSANIFRSVTGGILKYFSSPPL